MKIIKSNILFGMFLLLPLLGFSQSGCVSVPCDFVNNGDFEQNSSLPTFISQINKSCGWMTANTATPDYFHGLSTLSTCVSVPCNGFGIEADLFDPTKKAYAGIINGIDNNYQYYLENVYTELNQTLLPNTDYTLTFDLSLAEHSNRTCKISAYLDSNTSFFSNSYAGINMSATTGIFLLSPIKVTNSNGWTTVTLNFNTGNKTGLKYLVIGGISPNPNNLNLTSNIPINTSCNLTNRTPLTPFSSYYYLDNVSLKKSIVNPFVICTGNTATLAVANPISGVTYNWYATQTATTILGTGTSFTTPVLTASTSYWVEAVGTPCRSEALVTVNNPITTSPILNYTMACTTNLGTILVTNPTAGATYTWYATQTSATVLGTGTSFTTPILNTTTYWVESSNTCNSLPRVAITVNPLVQLAGALIFICPGNTATFDVANPIAGVTYNWYATQTATTILGTGTSFTTPPLSANTSYWVEAVPNGLQSCRKQASVIVDSPITTSDLEYIIDCTTNIANIEIINPQAGGSTYTWYATQTSSTILGTGTYFTTPTIPSNTSSITYWLEESYYCGVFPRVAITVYPYVPFVATNITICPGDTTTLSVLNPLTGVSYNWYDTQTSYNPFNVDIDFTTPALSTTTSYWVEALSNSANYAGEIVSCRNMVTVTVIAPLTSPLLNYTWNCSTKKATVQVTNPQTGATYNWYDSQTSTTILGTGASYTTPVLSTPTTYWVESSNACNSLTRVPITVAPILTTCTNVIATKNGSTITASVQGSVSTGSTASYFWTLTRPNGTTQTQTTTTNSVSFSGNTVAGTYNITVNVNATLNGTTCTSTCGTTLQFCTANGSVGFLTNSAGSIPYSLTGTGNSQQVIEYFTYNGTFNPSTAPVTYTWTLINGNGAIQATATTSSNTWNYTYPIGFCLGCPMTIQCVAQMNSPFTCNSNFSFIYVHGGSLNGSGNGGTSNPCVLNVVSPSISTATQGLTYQFKGNAPSINGVLCTSWTNKWYIMDPNSGNTIATFNSVNNSIVNYTFPAYKNYGVLCSQTSNNCVGAIGVYVNVRSRFDTPTQRMSNSSSKEVSLSPNPTNDIVNIEIPNGDKIEEVHLFGINGILLDPEVHLVDNTFNLQKYPNAEYIVIIKTNVNDYNFKIIKK